MSSSDSGQNPGSTEKQTLDLSDLLNRVGDLPTLPAVAIEVLQLSRDEEAEVKDFTSVISADPAITAKILQVVNSASMHRGAEVTSLDRATTLLGINGVKMLALSFALTESLPRRGKSELFDYLGYWQQAIATAVFSRELVKLLNNKNEDEAFLSGLLARIGQLMLANTIPDLYAPAIEQTEERFPPATIESSILGFSHHQVGEALLKSWQFPRIFLNTVRFWGQPSQLPPDIDKKTQDLCYIVQTADTASCMICNANRELALKNLHEYGFQYFGLSKDEMNTFFVGLEESVAEMADVINIDMAGIEDYESIIAEARNQMTQIGLESAIQLQQTALHAKKLERENEKLSTLAHIDKLTGIPNRASFDAKLEEILEARFQPTNSNDLGIILMDIDNFKSFNDKYGHVIGDQVLAKVGELIQKSTRRNEFAARYGGEEFVVLASHTTIKDLQKIADRIRMAVAKGKLQYDDQQLSVTLSIGGACLKEVKSIGDGLKLLDMADQFLYEAKKAGGNSVICRNVHSFD